MDQQLHAIVKNDFALNHTEHRVLKDNYFILSPLKKALLNHKICFAQTSAHVFAQIILPASKVILVLTTLGSVVKQINEISLKLYA